MQMSQVGRSPWLETLFIALPAVLTPIITWLFSLRAASRRTSALDVLARRIEVLERADNLQRQAGAAGAYRQVLDAELHDILQDLAELRTPQTMQSSLGATTHRHPDWRSWLLTYEQASLKGSIYKGLFYVFLAFAALGGIGLISVASDPQFGTAEKIAVPIVGAGMYVAVALAFRAAAVRDYRKQQQKASSKPASASDVAQHINA